METRANFALIGALVMVSVVAAVAFILWMSQSQFNRNYDVYDMIFDGPVALESGASVRFNGIKVGEVQRVAIDRNDDSKVRARVAIDSETPVRTDSFARIDFAGITGTTFVQIQAGAPGSPRIERRPGEAIPIIQTQPSPLSELFAGSTDIVSNAQETIARVNALLSDDNLSTIQSILVNVDAVTAEVADTDGLLADLSGALAALELAGEDFSRAADAFVDFGDKTGVEVQSISAETQTLLRQFQDAAGKASDLLDEGSATAVAAREAIDGPTVAAMEEIRLLAQDVRLLTARLDTVVRGIEENPQSFLVGDPLPYEGAN